MAISLVLNVEECSEQAVSRGDAINEHVYDMIDPVQGLPNPTMESHFDYGARAGYWWIVRVMEKYGATCTVNACAEAVAVSPWLARDALARGYEISCRRYRWLSPKGMPEDEEREWIHRAVKTIAAACGVRPVGWHTRCLHMPNTRRLLIEEGGFVYNSDAYDDDLGILIVIVVEMAQNTPSVGFNLFMLQAFTGRDIFYVARASLPFFFVLILAIGVIVAFPEIATYLPTLVSRPRAAAVGRPAAPRH